MKRKNSYILTALAMYLMLLASCDEWKSVSESEKVVPLDVKVSLDIQVENMASTSGLKLKLDDYEDGYHYEQEFDGRTVSLSGVVPGIYTISVAGSALDNSGTEYYVAGNQVNIALTGENTDIKVIVQGLKVSPLVFKELYFAGSKPPVGISYFRDQFFEVYNNSSKVQYLDGIYFGNLYPGTATKTLPVWPAADGNDYVYAERVWKFPGNGTDYPLQPGESAVVAQFAVNHKTATYNPNSPVDCSHAEFEFNMDNTQFPNQKAIDMLHVFYNGSATKGTLKQYLMSVFGPAYCMFRVPQGTTYDPVNNVNLHSKDLSKPKSTTLYAKIPIKWVLDAVECVHNEGMASGKRVRAVLDAGMTWVGSSYCGQGVARKVSLNENGDTLRRANGALIFQDTNNSTDDFERNVTPVLHRYHVGVPSWNATY